MFGSYFAPSYFARVYFPGPGNFVEPVDFDVFVRVGGLASICRPPVDVAICRPAADVAMCLIRADRLTVTIPPDPGVEVS